MQPHDPWFGHPFRFIPGPICRRCGLEVTDVMWATDAPCPGGFGGILIEEEAAHA